jgi:hypothetical protein
MYQNRQSGAQACDPQDFPIAQACKPSKSNELATASIASARARLDLPTVVNLPNRPRD